MGRNQTDRMFRAGGQRADGIGHLAGQSVEDHGLSDVRSADDRRNQKRRQFELRHQLILEQVEPFATIGFWNAQRRPGRAAPARDGLVQASHPVGKGGVGGRVSAGGGTRSSVLGIVTEFEAAVGDGFGLCSVGLADTIDHRPETEYDRRVGIGRFFCRDILLAGIFSAAHLPASQKNPSPHNFSPHLLKIGETPCSRTAAALVSLLAASFFQHGLWWPERVDGADHESSPNDTVRTAEPQNGPVDLAAFARVVTSDPRRMSGAERFADPGVPQRRSFLGNRSATGIRRRLCRAEISRRPGLHRLAITKEMRFLRRVELHWGKTGTTPAADSVQLPVLGRRVGFGRANGSRFTANSKRPPQRLEMANLSRSRSTGRHGSRAVDFSAQKTPLVVQKVSAYGRVAWRTADLRVELEHPTSGKTARIDVYDGLLLGATEQDSAGDPTVGYFQNDDAESSLQRADALQIRSHRVAFSMGRANDLRGS